MTALTSDIAKFVATMQSGSVPAVANFGARIGMLDCVGTMIAGSDRRPAAQDVVQMAPAPPQTTLRLEMTGPRATFGAKPPGQCAAAHALDYDDVGMAAIRAPRSRRPFWPRAGRSGERRARLAAYVAGYEVWAALQEREPGALHERGFHPTAIWGTLSAAAACARAAAARCRSRPRTRSRIAASLAAGLVANFGTMTKSLHAGRTAQSGVFAARLAERASPPRPMCWSTSGLHGGHTRQG